jgi:D-alanyl-D-alanine-carboxypeptidase/D-alanyl-D-alanine-endopeptidase
MKRILVVFFPAFLAIVLQVATAQSIPDEIKASVKARVDNGINAGIVVGVIENSGVQYFSYGVKSMATKEPVNEHSVFEIGSISKTFTGIILADMVIRGEASLDDPLQKYLPPGVTAPTRDGASIKLVHLSNHTSSLPRMPDNFTPANPANPFADYSEKQLYAFLNSYKLTRDIGSQYEYSNYAAGLLGHVIALKKGAPYEKVMTDVIAKPLNMNDTRIALTPQMKNNLAMGHSEGVQVENWDIPTLAGAGAIRSTAVDMVKYLQANMGKSKTKLYGAMQLSHNNSRAQGALPVVGLGWHEVISPDTEIVWHNGGTGGYRTFAGFTKSGGRGVVVLSNSNAGVDDIGMHILNPKVPLTVIKPSVAMKIRGIIEAQGTQAGLNAYSQLKKDQGDVYDFSEGELNKLGSEYLAKGETDKALAVLTLNAEAYPQSSDVAFRVGEALVKKGEREKGVESFKKSVALNPGNQAALDRLKELGISTDDVAKDVVVDIQTLDSYVGSYQLAPGFILTISRDGSQLKAQATGQQEFPIFPRSKNVFYLKVVEAQVTFNQDEDGKVHSLTLHQAGQNVPGKKLEK